MDSPVTIDDAPQRSDSRRLKPTRLRASVSGGVPSASV